MMSKTKKTAKKIAVAAVGMRKYACSLCYAGCKRAS